MRTLYLDTFSGISGDMMLGLLIDLGVSLEIILSELGKLGVSGYRLEQRQEQRHGIGGTKVDVICEGRQPARNWQNIDTLIADSTLAPQVKERARNIFRKLGEAEAHVHKTTLAEVHFHEVGAVDAIVDIVGSVIALQQLGINRVLCSPLPMSSGIIKGSHGALPLPAPATLQILSGHPVVDAGCSKELVTPTGAAIAATLADFSPLPDMNIEKIGYGVGGWDLEDRPNLLRGIIGSAAGKSSMEHDTVTVIETHIDDTPAEILGSLLDQLLAQGALDAGFTPLQMKKNRPGTKLTVVARQHDAPELARVVLRESSAIGVRMHDCRRLKLKRETAAVDTGIGKADIKLIFEGDQLLRITPEHSSCVRLAESSGKPLIDIYRLVTAAANRRHGLEE